MTGYGNAWEQIGELYALPGIMPQCLALQERAGVSVTALLSVVVHAAGGGGALKPSAAARVAEVSEAYEAAVLRPLRQARDGLRSWTAGPREDAAQGLRQGMLEHELAAERFCQEMVLDLLGDPDSTAAPEDPLADVCRSVARYLAALGAVPDAELHQSLAHILTAALEDYDGLHVSRVLARAFGEDA
ncbi:MAG: TIGR02444 family protein [Aquisalimonadaceae bacterium]